MSDSRPRILLVGAGSLVGVGILQALNGRRDGVTLIGGDADPHAYVLSQCDEQVVLPLTTDPAYRDAVDAAAGELGADLVIACRDPDAIVVAQANDDPTSPVVAPTAPAPLLEMTRDKYETYLWCKENDVPFVPTVAMASATAGDELGALVHEWGLPLIAKPRDGSGSLGVWVLTEPRHLEAILGEAGMIVQPFLEAPPVEKVQLDLSRGIPLFFEVPTDNGTAVMALIGRDGEIGPICPHGVAQRLGRNESLARLDDEVLLATARRSAVTFRDAGWRGPLNLCFRESRGRWLLFEVNPRFTGGTSGRLLLGCDEVAWVLNDWLGRDVIPSYSGPTGNRVVRYLTDYVDPHPAEWGGIRDAQL